MSAARTVLVVDDEPEVRAMIAEYLGSRGYAVVTAEDARTMFAVLEREAVDLVLLDRTMPDGDALHLMPSLRNRFAIPVIMVTALGADGDRISGLEIGADDYITKPFNPRELAARVGSVIRRTRDAEGGRGAGGRAAGRPPALAQRRMAAVLCADVAGYVRLMKADETGTVRTLWSHRRNVIDPAFAAHDGRLVKNTGDGFLGEFSSIGDALVCAIQIQDEIARRNEAIASEQRMRFRMGLNWCRIVADHEDIHGDGVNIAARLQTLAEPGGICVSRTIRDNLTPRADIRLEDMGDQYVKNISEAIPAYRVCWRS